MKVNSSSYSLGGILVAPLERHRRVVVVADVTHDFPGEICLGFEDAASNDVALDFREPDFDLVKPRRVSGREVKMELGVLAQESFDGLGFVGREIVGNDVDFPTRFHTGNHLLQKDDELGAGMAAGGPAQDLSAGRVECRIERKGAMAEVFEAVPFGPPRRERQHRVQAIERLNGTLFIHAEDGSVGGRAQIETNDVGRLGLEIGIIAVHVLAPPVGLQPGLGPDSGHAHMVDAKLRGQLAAAPVCGAIGGFAMQPPVEEAGLNLLATRLGLAATMPAKESGQSLREKSIPPKAHRVHTALLSAAGLTQTVSTRSQAQHDVGPTNILIARATTAAHAFEFPPLGRTKNNAICHREP
jgi:hypothetical protein